MSWQENLRKSNRLRGSYYTICLVASEAFHDKRDIYNCSVDYYIANKSHTFIIGMYAHTKLALGLYWVLS